MSISRAILFFYLLMILPRLVSGQEDPSKVCRVRDGQLIFSLDKRWTPAQKKQLTELYDLDSILIADAFAAKPVINDSGITWKTRKINANVIELFKEQGQSADTDLPKDVVFLVDDASLKVAGAKERESAPYGINRLTLNTVQQLSGNKIRFFLRGHPASRKVFLAGSFNEWSTIRTPMQKVDSGWMITLELAPGKYSYKYILDGKWYDDPFNKNKEDDLHGGKNSIFFCYNHQFVLNGFTGAKNVILTGSFNSWNQHELRMIRIRGRWLINMYLRDGTHAYKFIVDGQWMNDPANRVTRPDGRGNTNSFMSIGDTFYFSLRGFPKASKIVVAGNFNLWNASELLMNRVEVGWELPYVLPAGNYEYKFLVDGHWITDPENPNTTGSGDYTNSILAIKPNFTFRLEKFPDAKNVFVAGSFNGWNTSGYRMYRNGGAWVFPVSLKPGKYTYKFIVDGKYFLDPSNELWEDNEYGTGNSVLWVNP